MKSLHIFFFACILLSASCKKDSSTPEFSATDKGSIEIEFDNVAGTDDIVLNTGTYTNASGEAYTISTFNYYISNIKLINENGTEYSVPQDESYFLIKEDDESTHVAELENVPAGNYTGITFTVGVDAARSTAPASELTGVLDPLTGAAGMYWSLNEGYIFLKMAGTSAASTETDNSFAFHIGGYGGAASPVINNLKTVTLAIPGGTKATIRKDVTPEMHLFVDAQQVMTGATNISIAAHSTVMFEDYSTNIANNYANMFKIDHIHND